MTLTPPTSTLFPYTTLFRSPAQEDAMTNLEAYTALMAHALKNGFTMDEWDNAVILSWGFDDVGYYEDQEHRSEEHTSELQSHSDLVCRLLLEKKKKQIEDTYTVKQKLTDRNASGRVTTRYFTRSHTTKRTRHLALHKEPPNNPSPSRSLKRLV